RLQHPRPPPAATARAERACSTAAGPRRPPHWTYPSRRCTGTFSTRVPSWSRSAAANLRLSRTPTPATSTPPLDPTAKLARAMLARGRALPGPGGDKHQRAGPAWPLTTPDGVRTVENAKVEDGTSEPTCYVNGVHRGEGERCRRTARMPRPVPPARMPR